MPHSRPALVNRTGPGRPAHSHHGRSSNDLVVPS